MQTVSQPSARPTRKVLVGAAAGVIAAAATQWFNDLAALSPWLAFLASDASKAFAPVAGYFAAAWLVKSLAGEDEGTPRVEP